MKSPLRVLYVEDIEDDVVLAERELRRGGLDVAVLQVQTEAEMEAALSEPWDLILADYRLPAFGAASALEVLQRTGLDIPFVIVSGTIDEERAVSTLRSGAHDFVTKDRLARLVPAVERALRERTVRESARRTDDMMRRHARELDSLARNVPDILARFDRDLRLDFANPAIESVAGKPARDCIGSTLLGLGIAAPVAEIWNTALRRVFTSGQPEVVEFRAGTLDLQARIVPEIEAAGVVESVLCVARDVTDQKHAEAELRARADQQAAVAALGQRALAGIAPAALFAEAVGLVHATLGVPLVQVTELTPIGSTLTVRASEGWKNEGPGPVVFKADATSLAGLALVTDGPVVASDLARDPRIRASARLDANGVRSGMSVVIRGAAGAWGVLSVHSRRPRHFGGNEVHYFQAVADILGQALERSRAEAASKASEDRVHAIIEAVTDGILFVDSHGTIVFANHRAEEILDLQRSELGHRSYDDTAWNITTPDGGPFPNEQLPFVRVMATGAAVYDVEHAIRHGDGRHVQLSICGAPLHGPAGQLEGMVASVRDQTERHVAESRIRLQARLLDAVGEAVIATDAAGRITYWNRAAEKLYGWTAEEVYLRSIVDVTPSSGGEQQAAEKLESLISGRSWSGEFDVRRKDGSLFRAFVTDTPLFDDTGVLSGVVGISADMTARMKLEAELRQAQKMEAVGRLAGGVAHDFNNILTSISGFTHFLLEGLPVGHPLRADALEIQVATDRASALTRQLLAFSRKQVIESRSIDFCAVLDSLEAMLRRLIGEDVQFAVTSAPGTGWVFGDPGLLEQVVVNLVVNAVDAVDAMPAGGSVTVALANVEVCEAQAADLGIGAGPYVGLTVSDTGDGIAPDVLPHIFEPFFTTKPQGKGTGLGLSTVHGIVRQANGSIAVESTAVGGTEFRVYLPRVDATETAPRLPAPSAAAGRGETVLIVEDDAAVRQIARRSLERGGYRVLEAAMPSEALDSVIPGHAGVIDLLLTDVILPEMHGPQLAQEVLRMLPTVRVLLMSGYLPEDMKEKVQQSLLDPETRLLAKPFTLHGLLAGVRETLDSPRAAAAMIA